MFLIAPAWYTYNNSVKLEKILTQISGKTTSNSFFTPICARLFILQSSCKFFKTHCPPTSTGGCVHHVKDTTSQPANLLLWHTGTSLQHELPSVPVSWSCCFTVVQPPFGLTCCSFRRVTGCPMHTGESSLTVLHDLASTGLRCTAG